MLQCRFLPAFLSVSFLFGYTPQRGGLRTPKLNQSFYCSKDVKWTNTVQLLYWSADLG